MATSETQEIQKLMTELKSVTAENEALKYLKKSLESKEGTHHEHIDLSQVEKKAQTIFATLYKERECLLTTQIAEIKGQIETKNDYLKSLERIKQRFIQLRNQREINNTKLKALQSASSKYLQLISKLSFKKNLLSYEVLASRVIDLKFKELSEEGIDVAKILKKIKKICLINDLAFRISTLEAEIRKLNKKKEKLEVNSDSSIEELQESWLLESNLS